MRYAIGIDEAGYGPNLGPLVVGVSVWREVDAGSMADWQQRFRTAWLDTATSATSSTRPLAIDDSKKLYSSGRGLDGLETVVQSCLRLLASHRHDDTKGGEPLSVEPFAAESWSDLCRLLNAESEPPTWHRESSVRLPLTGLTFETVRECIQRWRSAEKAAGMELERLCCRIVFPKEWNKLLRRWDNKATVLSRISLTLLAAMIDDLPDESEVAATCDKHGGRQRYAPFLYDLLPDCSLANAITELPEKSCYRCRCGEREVGVGFFRQGESHLPVALASMVAKYVREVAMSAFNAFWRGHLPHLKPTAGYPVDARRFASETAELRRRLRIADTEFWRDR